MGVGIGALKLVENTQVQTTYDETILTKGSPSDPPPESNGTFNIVKTYRIKNGTTYKQEKNTYRKNVSNKIKIESEDGYKLVGYMTRTEFNYTKPNAEGQEAAWKTSVGTIGQPGIVYTQLTDTKEGTTVTLTPPANTLYILLEKEGKPTTSGVIDTPTGRRISGSKTPSPSKTTGSKTPSPSKPSLTIVRPKEKWYVLRESQIARVISLYQADTEDVIGRLRWNEGYKDELRFAATAEEDGKILKETYFNWTVKNCVYRFVYQGTGQSPESSFLSVFAGI